MPGGPEVDEPLGTPVASGGPGPARALRVTVLDSWSRDPARGSGTAVATRGLVGALRTLGHDVTVLRPRATAAGAHSGIPTLPRRLLYNLRLRLRLEPTDMDLLVGTDLDGAFLPSRLPVPYVVALRGVAADEAHHDVGAARLERRVATWLERRNTARADLVTTPSAYSARVASGAYGIPEARMAVVPEGIDVDLWEELRADPPPRPDSRPTILSVARQYRRKNTRALLAALPRVIEAVPDARCRIVGGGPELPALRRQTRSLGLEGQVELLGALPDDGRVRVEYLHADCFCLPTLQESFGIVFLEAMAAGLPVVASNRAAVPEVVPHGEAGLLVDPDDPREVGRALVRILSDPDVRDRMGRAGAERARRFTYEATARRFLDGVRPLLAGEGR